MLSKAAQKLTAAAPGAATRGMSTGTEAFYDNPNFPMAAGGRVHHLNVKFGDVANRVISVGDRGRAETFSKHFDDGKVHVVTSSRGFVTYTGRFNKVPVSVIATGMGFPMMDFVVREPRHVVKGDMAFLRFGSCGGLSTVKAGDVVVAHSGILVRREPDAFSDSTIEPYSISKPVAADPELTALYTEKLKALITEHVGRDVVEGINVTADSFYSSQARIDDMFDDRNTELLARIAAEHPDAKSCEMETFHLFDLARSSKGTIKASGAAMAMANRLDSSIVDGETIKKLEYYGGVAALETITAFPLAETMDDEPTAAWNQE